MQEKTILTHVQGLIQSLHLHNNVREMKIAALRKFHPELSEQKIQKK